LFIMFAYNLAIVVWVGYMASKQSAREDKTVLLTTQRWDQSLTDLQPSDSPDSLIPMFEGMVDRAFSRTPDHPLIGHDAELERMLISSGISNEPTEKINTRLYPESVTQKT
jgi:hypothetical protein